MKPGRTSGIRKRRTATLLALMLAILATATGNDPLGAAPLFTVPPTDSDATGTHQPLPAAGFTVSPLSQTRVWLAAHPTDPRTPALRAALGARPDALWLTGTDRDLPNLTEFLAVARSTATTPVIALYNIPGRDDGITGPTARIAAAGYRTWVDRIASTIGRTGAIVVVEPDALWLADRQYRDDHTGFDDRLATLRYAVTALHRNPGTHVYLDAGTSSGSVTPDRMAVLLRGAGASTRTGFAVNVSSFGPPAEITAYAQRIRDALMRAGVADPHYIVDTSRNGNPVWDNNTWCNPPGRKIGSAPTARPSPTAPGLDANIWVKAPGTSDGSCGVGKGSSGGDFLPGVAMAMIR
ncbi:glycoside hydrolase family 6 protein [Gordonia sp. TBRC 11910]|uniref:Glucanase n=1 Tax=Gordonia asplenii TaxID=2725283 RepID=A0A848KW52_9ACTN|nr:glycoside hydrolase family 6 protein [Gordonia asplenii]NMO02896.1 glycoside hydrolase family 6 protein [Gordonia asplenii]